MIISNGHLLIYGSVSKKERAKAGVACLIQKEGIPEIRNWEYTNERLLVVEMSKRGEIEE